MSFSKTKTPTTPLSPYSPLLLHRHSGHVRQECLHRGSCRLFRAVPASFPATSPLHCTTPPYIPRQHVQLDEQPVSRHRLLPAIPSSHPRSTYSRWSKHWQLAVSGSTYRSRHVCCPCPIGGLVIGCRMHRLLSITGHTNATIQEFTLTTRVRKRAVLGHSE